MTIFAKTALKAFEYVEKGYLEENAWDKAICDFTDSTSTRSKGCPKVAFCGLVSSKNKWAKMDNAIYARKALDILRSNDKRRFSKDELWSLIGNDGKSQNGQMDVVLALWYNGKIK